MSSIHIVPLLPLNVDLSTMLPLGHPCWVLTASSAFLSVASSSPTAEEYTVDVEISFENASFLESIKASLYSLSFPIQGNSTDQATTILSIEVTTGESKTCCFRTEGRTYQEEGCLHSLLLEQIVLRRQVRWPKKAWGMIYDSTDFQNEAPTGKPCSQFPYFKWWPNVCLVVCVSLVTKYVPRYCQVLHDKLLVPIPLGNQWV